MHKIKAMGVGLAVAGGAVIGAGTVYEMASLLVHGRIADGDTVLIRCLAGAAICLIFSSAFILSGAFLEWRDWKLGSTHRVTTR